MRTIGAASVALLLLAGCRASLPVRATSPTLGEGAALGGGAAPGGEEGPGGFVPRGSARNFYAGAGGRLWYYMNNYYWVPDSVRDSSRIEDLWIRAEVVERFRDLQRWPDGKPATAPEPKRTLEYWRVGPGGRSVRLDNHKDYVLLDDAWCAGAVEIRVTLTLGRLSVRKDARSPWRPPSEGYVLETRNYADDRGIGAERTSFVALAREPVTVWGYSIPWSTHPSPLTRSDWQDLALPEWVLIERLPPPERVPAAVTAPDDPAEVPPGR